MSHPPRPDLTLRPLTSRCARVIRAAPPLVFSAWTSEFDRWFAQPGTLVFPTTPGQPYFFYNREDWGRHPHYGRILALEPDRLLELTWLTGNGEAVGTEGAETILRVELAPHPDGTALQLTHSGFVSEASRDGHAENWPLALDILDAALQT